MASGASPAIRRQGFPECRGPGRAVAAGGRIRVAGRRPYPPEATALRPRHATGSPTRRDGSQSTEPAWRCHTRSMPSFLPVSDYAPPQLLVRTTLGHVLHTGMYRAYLSNCQYLWIGL